MHKLKFLFLLSFFTGLASLPAQSVGEKTATRAYEVIQPDSIAILWKSRSSNDTLVLGQSYSVQGKILPREALKMEYKGIISPKVEAAALQETYPVSPPEKIRLKGEPFIPPLDSTIYTHTIKETPARQPEPISIGKLRLSDNRNYATQLLGHWDGLPCDQVNELLEDRSGNIWMGTDCGLSVYNGTQLFNYGKEHGLPEGKIINLYEDHKGQIWFYYVTNINQLGTVCFNGHTFKEYFLSTEKGDKESIIALNILEDKENNLWIANATELLKWDGLSWQKYSFKAKMYYYFQMSLDEDGSLWFANTNSKSKLITLYSYREGRFTKFQTPLKGSIGLNFIIDREGNIWGSQYWTGGIYQIKVSSDPANPEILHYERPPGTADEYLWYLCPDPKKGIWMANENGLFHFNGEQSRKFASHQIQASDMMFDQQNKLWIASRSRQIEIINIHGFTRYQGQELSSDLSSFLKFSYLNSSAKEELWFGFPYTENPANHLSAAKLYTLQNNQVLSYDFAPFVLESYQTMGLSPGSSDMITSGINLLRSDHKESTSIVYWSGMLAQLEGNKLTHYYFDEQYLEDAKIRGMTQDAQGNQWFTMWNGGIALVKPDKIIYFSDKALHGELVLFDEQGTGWLDNQGIITKLQLSPDGVNAEVTPLFSNLPRFFGMSLDAQQNIWFNDAVGLIRYDGEEFRAYRNPDNSYRVSNFVMDQAGNQWLGTSGGIELRKPVHKSGITGESPPPRFFSVFSIQRRKWFGK